MLTFCFFSIRCCVSFALQCHQHEINPFPLQEFLVSSSLNSPAVLKPNDDVGSFDGWQAVSDGDRGAAEASLKETTTASLPAQHMKCWEPAVQPKGSSN